MREILYDMAYNSISGRRALETAGLLMLYVFMWLALSVINKVIYDGRNRFLKNLLVKKGKIRCFHKIVCGVLCGIWFILVIHFFFKDWRVEHQSFVYIHTNMAAQRETDVLFEHQVKEEIVEVEEELSELQKLHVSETNPMTEITEEGIEERIDLFDAIYRAGTKDKESSLNTTDAMKELLEQCRYEVNSMNPATVEEYEEEFEKRDILYKYYKYNSDLYHCSRAQKDIIEEGRADLENEELLRAASKAVNMSECFLQYRDRNINTPEEPIVIEVEDVAFTNGKVYYQLYEEARNMDRAGLESYGKEFLVNAYVCILQAKEEIDSEDKAYYAKVNYYIGNCGQLLLNEIPKEDSLYRKIGEDALAHYANAWVCIELFPGNYGVESGMETNIENGMNTLAEWLEIDLNTYMNEMLYK